MLGKHFVRFLDQFLDSPFSGIAPWVWMAMLAGPGRFELATGGALAVSLLVLALCWQRGITVHVIEFLGVSYFVGLTIVGLHASRATKAWLELWSGDVTNALLAVFAVISVVLRRPYTMVYTRHKVAPEHWGTSLFVRANMVVTAVWAGAFAAAAGIGFTGDALLHDTDNFWTGWILQLAALLFAVAFTEFYADHARAAALGEIERPSWLRTVQWVPPFVIGTGVAGWVLDAVAVTGAVVLVIAGAVGGVLIRKRTATQANPRQTLIVRGSPG